MAVSYLGIFSIQHSVPIELVVNFPVLFEVCEHFSSAFSVLGGVHLVLLATGSLCQVPLHMRGLLVLHVGHSFIGSLFHLVVFVGDS